MQRLSLKRAKRRRSSSLIIRRRGSRGAKNYGAQHVEVQTMKLLVDLNCVGDGDTFVISAKMAQDKPEYAAVREPEENARHPKNIDAVLRARGCKARAIIGAFVCGGVSAYHHSAGVGLITGRIHASRDTVCHENWTISPKVADAAQKWFTVLPNKRHFQRFCFNLLEYILQ